MIDTYNRITGFSETDIKQINLMYKQECGGGGGGRFRNYRSYYRLTTTFLKAFKKLYKTNLSLNVFALFKSQE